MTWKVDQLSWKFFWSFLKTLSTTETFVFFLRHHVTSGATFEKKKCCFFFFFSKFLQILEFQMSIFGRNFGRSAENSTRNIFLPQILTKKFLSKIRPLHHLKIQKVDPPFSNGHYGAAFACYPRYHHLIWSRLTLSCQKLKSKSSPIL